jgi:ArsR family transcriptional regulator
VAAVCRALADPTRLEILRLIAAQPAPLCVCDIVARFDRQQSTVSYHLRVLREARLVRATRRGAWVYYAVDPEGLARLARLPALLQEQAVAVG